jgi:hypothetical protein
VDSFKKIGDRREWIQEIVWLLMRNRRRPPSSL